MVFAEILMLTITIIVAILLFKLLFIDLIYLLIHAVIGLLILYLVKALGLRVSISFWTILICAFGGIIGALIVIILSYLKIAFVE
jgi:hypothetical protein